VAAAILGADAELVPAARLTLRMVLLPILVVLATRVQPPPADELLEAGIYAEETKGDLNASIEIYSRIAAESDVKRSTVAQALLRVGMCYLKSGNHDDAKAAFEKLARRYPEQKSIITRIPATSRQSGLSSMRARRVSVFLSRVLRHDPAAAGVALDAGGWAVTDALLAGAALRRWRSAPDRSERCPWIP
jgi:tetratricopeptide (TPR) repeat protein